MFAKLVTAGKRHCVTSNLKHDIKYTVNGISLPFTVTNDEVHSFGLYDRNHSLIGYFTEEGLTQDIKASVHTDGYLEPLVRNGPDGCYIKSVSKYYYGAGGTLSKYRSLH